jgi:ubiquinone/menaquinone biosynthesis C-methylase UbiE
MSDQGSVAFDRAAEYYDATRKISPHALRATLDMLTTELGGRDRILEVGVGTGLMALPIAERLPLIGIDLSMPMVRKLLDKAGGRSPFPLALGDATRLPLVDVSVGGAYYRHVLHLIPDYRAAVGEACRVIRPGGVVVVSAGADSTVAHEIDDLFEEEERQSARYVGLDPDDSQSMDAAFAEHGAVPREMASIAEDSLTATECARAIDEGLFSWTWRVPEADRRRAADKLRAWADRRGLQPDEPMEPDLRIRWRAYDLRG